MAPEPQPEFIDCTNWNNNNLNIGIRAVSDSESDDDDDHGAEGYIPLSQEPTDGDLLLDIDEEDNQWWINSVNTNSTQDKSTGDDESTSNSSSNSSSSRTSNEIQVPSGSTELLSLNDGDNVPAAADIDLDPIKIDQVKSVMASFTLPKTSIPEWAIVLSEELWKKKLMDRIKEMNDRRRAPAF